MNSNRFDVVIIGAGIIGLASALELITRHPDKKLAVLEKEDTVASQQTGHNSGVIHSGIYYSPGSLKAKFCVEGRASMNRFCEENDIPTWTCGKLIIATSDSELSRLAALYERGKANKVEGLEMVGPERIKEIEPFVEAKQALWAPKTGIVDFRKVATAYASKLKAAGGKILLGSELTKITNNKMEIVIHTRTGDEILTKKVINCAGLHSDLIALMAGERPGVRIVPFRGEYYVLNKDSDHIVKGLIYPVPDPAFPFLGVHLTQTMKGLVEAGPNAVLAFKREGYRKTDVSLTDLAGIIKYPGFWRLIASNWRTGLWEINRSIRKSAFVSSLQKLIPSITANQLAPGGSGVRAQAVKPNGSLVDDFYIQQSRNFVHVLNAPSPGATSSLVIGRYIANIAEESFSLNN